ncbi:TIGR04282 family arsenosugar biosynthesis glycosyltransferase [Thioalkalicoccus limnaeus]|uniref:TIGR04282 family arsenosugar biosynthesis glycosyltransferase n=1 Tax=Thioalkalicoccus limnaeus TaxID=120681 RepID=A0ABV4BJZ4_9GAMM
MFDDRARILIFAKAPIPGQVKTRLIPAVGAAAAAALHGRMLRDLLARIGPQPPAPIELWCAPDDEHPLFVDLAAKYGLMRHRQRGRDLGERMYRAAQTSMGETRFAILIGADCPGLDRSYLQRSLIALADGADAVLGPAEDGGYVLLGLRRLAMRLFEDMPWGTDEVAAITRTRMADLGWRWTELATLWDLDRPEDLARAGSPACP